MTMPKTLVLALAMALTLATGQAQAAEEAATATLAVGTVNAIAPDGSNRLLHDGDLVYSGELIKTGVASYANLDFTDGSTIMLRPDTQFSIENYHFDENSHLEDTEPGAPPSAAPAASTEDGTEPPPAPQENAFFKLLKGGLRAVSGLIGHVQRDNYRMSTPAATIGIRGTDYEARYCGSDCGDEKDAGGAPADGLYTAVDKGSIAVANQGGETVTRAGQYLYVQHARARAMLYNQRPHALRHMELPRRYRALVQRRHEKLMKVRTEHRRKLLKEYRRKHKRRHPHRRK
jgi:hypothetical protein